MSNAILCLTIHTCAQWKCGGHCFAYFMREGRRNLFCLWCMQPKPVQGQFEILSVLTHLELCTMTVFMEPIDIHDKDLHHNMICLLELGKQVFVSELFWFYAPWVKRSISILSMGYVPDYSLICFHIFCNGLSTEWIRKNQGNYSTGLESKNMILKWKRILYHGYRIDLSINPTAMA